MNLGASSSLTLVLACLPQINVFIKNYLTSGNADNQGKKKEKRKNYICTLRSTKTDTRKKNKETKTFSDPSHRSAWKLPVARCQIAHQPFLQHSSDEPKPGIQTWREQFSLIAAQPCVQHLSTTQLNFSFHHGQDSEFVYFYCNRSYEDKHN